MDSGHEDSGQHARMLGAIEAHRVVLAAVVGQLDPAAQQRVRLALARRAVVDGEPPQVEQGFLEEAAALVQRLPASPASDR